MLVDYDIVKFCSIECRLQNSGELSVGWMVDGFIYAEKMKDFTPVVQDVLNLGQLVDPIENALGFRTCGIQIGYEVKMDWQDIPRQMNNLMDSIKEITPAEFFKEYEEIHPFGDGNGRTGVILYNWLNETLDVPVWAPNYWNDPRRTIGYGA